MIRERAFAGKRQWKKDKGEKNMSNFLPIKDAVAKYIDGCAGKVSAPFSRLFIRGILAGVMIALGASGSSVAAHSVDNVGLARLLSGVVFPVGLMMVIVLGAELFTGDCLMVMGTVDKKHTPLQLIRCLVIVYIGNLAGALLLAAAAYASGQFDYSAGGLGGYTIKVALGKATISFGKAVVSGILCNFLVCAAVMMATCAKNIMGKLFCAFFAIMLFVVAGFEHCVANMYYIPAGIFAKGNPAYVQAAVERYGCAADQISRLSWQNFFVTNLIPVTIGNIIGGMVFVGLALYYGNKEKAAQ